MPVIKMEVNACAVDYVQQMRVPGGRTLRFDFTEAEDGGFSFVYYPEDSDDIPEEVDHVGNLCREHNKGISKGVFETLRDKIKEVIQIFELAEDMAEVAEEEEYNPDDHVDPDHDEEEEEEEEEDDQEDEEGTDVGMDEDDAEAVREHVEAGKVGTKVTPDVTLSPKAAAALAALDEEENGGQGFKAPSKNGAGKYPQPGPAEKLAMKQWHVRIKDADKLEYRIPAGGAIPQKTLEFWYASNSYQEFRKAAVNV